MITNTRRISIFHNNHVRSILREIIVLLYVILKFYLTICYADGEHLAGLTTDLSQWFLVTRDADYLFKRYKDEFAFQNSTIIIKKEIGSYSFSTASI
jgi:hypothetical protein